MQPSKIRRALLMRLAYLEVTLEIEKMGDSMRAYREDEREALNIVLDRLGLMREEDLEKYKTKTREWIAQRGSNASPAA